MTRKAEAGPHPLDGTAERLREAVARCAEGTLSANVALLRLAMAAERAEEVEAALLEGMAARPESEAGRLKAALVLWRGNPGAFDTIKSVLDGVEHDAGGGIEGWAAAFDRLAREAPEGGVALYALGNPDLLRAATNEVVERLGDWGLLGRTRVAVEIGCGIGRFVATLSPLVGHVTGLDVSAGMIERAQERCAGLPNVALAVTSGRDLARVADGSADLVLAADVFPYLVEAGDGFAAVHVSEAARALRPGGALVILNYSYRGDPGLDRVEVAALAERHGLAVERMAEGDFALWDAATFVLRRP